VSAKLLPIFVGPVEILEIGNVPVLYLVRQEENRRKQKFWVHVSKLKKYVSRDFEKLGLTNMTQQQETLPSNDSDEELADDLEMPTLNIEDTSFIPWDDSENDPEIPVLTPQMPRVTEV